MFLVSAALLVFTAFALGSGGGAGTSWPPRQYLLKRLVAGIRDIPDSFHPETGRFGTEPWICNDQNVLLPLAAAWATEDEQNPYFHDDELLHAIARGGEALTEDQDEDGAWVFRKKDHSTWGQVMQPWTYSRWVRAFHMAGDALPAASRAVWEEGLLRGYTTLRRRSARVVRYGGRHLHRRAVLRPARRRRGREDHPPSGAAARGGCVVRGGGLTGGNGGAADPAPR